MKHRRPTQHIRRYRSGRWICVNKGIRYKVRYELGRKEIQYPRDDFFRLIAIDSKKGEIGRIAFHVPHSTIDHLYVNLDERKHGIGSQLIHILEKKARELGKSEVHINIATGNDPKGVKEFLWKQGFEVKITDDGRFVKGKKRL